MLDIDDRTVTTAAVFDGESEATSVVRSPLAEIFRDNPIFNETVRMLCARIMPPALSTKSVKFVEPNETAAAYRR